jgi:hypothetical protein
VVSFAGTDTSSVANWIDDLDEVKTPWPLQGCQVRRKWEGGREGKREGGVDLLRAGKKARREGERGGKGPRACRSPFVVRPTDRRLRCL